uniref:F-box protein At5g07610-like n=1 Tax=Elaeis guineensis var. tenera TaxID=51953 RepID=A0A6I9QJZ1_ELAGV|nr:F-box protein At5g07610-like [Elaeis guineensis]
MSPSSSSAVEVPSDLIAFEILARLPAKSLLRFKCVCKEWLALASDSFFLLAHTRYNPFTVSGFLIEDFVTTTISSFSVDGGASPAIPDPSLSSLNRRSAASNGIYIWQSCNGLVLCTTSSFQSPLRPFLLNPTTMQYREIPDPPADLYPFKYQLILIFDPSTSFQYRIACLSSNITHAAFDPTASQFHVEIYSSDAGTWELLRETVPGETVGMAGVYWNGSLNWLAKNGVIVSFDLEQRLVKTTQVPPQSYRRMIRYFGKSRGHLHMIEIAAEVPSCDFDWLHFYVFGMGKDNQSRYLKYNVDLNGVSDLYPEINSTTSDEHLLRISADIGKLICPVFFARGGKGEDDKLYLCNSKNILCYNLADKTCRKIFAMDSFITKIPSDALMRIDVLPFAHSLFSP